MRDEKAEVQATTSALEERPSLSHRKHGPTLKRAASFDQDSGEASLSDDASTRSIVDSLDLAPSLPYWFAYVRARMAEYAQDIEQLVHANQAHKLSILVPLEHMETRLSAAHDAMVRMMRDWSLAHGGAEWFDKLSSLSEVKGHVYTLMTEWERRVHTLHPTLFDSVSAAEMKQIPRRWASRMPATAAYLSEEVQRSLAAVRGHIQNVTLPSLRESSSSWAHDAQSMLPQHMPSLHDLPQHVEEALQTIGRCGREAGAQFVHAVHDVEDALYHAALRLAKNGRELIPYQSLPVLWRNNDFITTGYRFIPKDQWHNLILSAFRVHNETGNIHTHLSGLLLVSFLFWLTGSVDSDTTTTADRWMMIMYLLAAAKCLLCSISWHVMAGCADIQWFMCFACIDYTGISWLVAASLETLVFNGFYCQPGLIAIYTIGVIAIGIAMSVLPWSAWFNDPSYRSIRIAMFIGMACMGFVPFVHGAVLHGFGPMVRFYGPVVPSLLSYIAGVVVYGLRWPERLAPGKFDIVGHSHQLWHLAIVLAIYLHYKAVLSFEKHRYEFSCSAGYTPSPTLEQLFILMRRVSQYIYNAGAKDGPLTT